MATTDRFFATYADQLKDGARRLLEVQNPNKGWGLTVEGSSSIVNTAEALNVIQAAGIEDERTWFALEWLTKVLPKQFRTFSEDADDTARGVNIRYITFFMDGLLTNPEFAFSPSGIDSIRLCIGWLDQFKLGGGIADQLTSNLVSYHQTARALTSLSKLLYLDVHNRLPFKLAESARRIADGAATFLLANQRMTIGAWKATPQPESVLSPAKTAIAATALGYYRLISSEVKIDAARERASQWLMQEYDKWRTSKSDDPQEAASSWEHLDYAECVRAVVLGNESAVPQLSRSWSFIVRHWDETRLLWTEPSNGSGNVTIRAAYHAVMAFESARASSRLVMPPRIEAPSLGLLKSIRSIGETRFEIRGGAGTAIVQFENAASLRLLFEALIQEPKGLSTAALAKVLNGNARAVPTYKGRLNDSVRTQTRGRVTELVKTSRDERGTFIYKIEVA